MDGYALILFYAIFGEQAMWEWAVGSIRYSVVSGQYSVDGEWVNG
jgi:hypothetical protein